MHQQQVGGNPIDQVFPPGARFVLQGLQARPAFNGQHVLVIEYMHDQERYCVEPVDPNGPLPATLAIRPQNLVHASATGSGRSVMQPQQNNRQYMSNAEMPHSLPPRQMLGQSTSMQPEISVIENDGMHGAKSDILPLGSTAVIHGLKGQQVLNGEMVVIEEYMENEGRYRVTPVDPNECSMPVLAIKPQNLLPCKDPRRRERNAFDASSCFGPSSSYGSQALGSQRSSSSRSESKRKAPQRSSSSRSESKRKAPQRSSSSRSESKSKAPQRSSSSRSESKSKAPSMARFKPGSHARLTGLKKKTKLNGHMVRIVEYLRDKDRYRVEPLDVEAFDVCAADLMAIRPENLISEDPMHGGSAPLAPGTRAVLINLSGKPACNGQLVTVIRYMVENGTYEVRPLGRGDGKAAPAKVLFLGPDKLKPAPQSAFWVQMNIKGHQLRLPVSCKVHRDKIGQANVHVMLDAFAGLDQVIPAAKIILGEDHCDWMDDGEVIAALKASKSQTITLDIQDEEAHAGLKLDEAFISEEKKPAIFEAMVEFELIQPTKKTVQVDSIGTLLVYKLKFPDTAQKETKTKALKTKRPALKKTRSTMSLRSSKSVQSSNSLQSSSSVRKPRIKKEKVNKSEWNERESQSVSGVKSSRSVSGVKKAPRRQSLQHASLQHSSSSGAGLKRGSRRNALQRSISSSVCKPNSMRHLLVQSNSNRRSQLEPPGSTHIPIRERTSSQEEAEDDDDSFAGVEELELNDLAEMRASLKSTHPFHSPNSVACIVPKEVQAMHESTCSSMGASFASLSSELDMQDLFVHIEAKEKEKQDLEKSVQLLDKRLSLVQVTCEAASQKLTLLRGEQASSDVKEIKDAKKTQICGSSDNKVICDSSDSDSDSDAASQKLTQLRGGQASSDVKEIKDAKETQICGSSDNKVICDSSDSDSDDEDDDDE
jgi:CDGSH-type Zn-finger protein